MDIQQITDLQKAYFNTGKTKSVAFRKATLKSLQSVITNNEKAICDALYKDFKKPEFEAVATETMVVLQELKLCINNLEKWSKPQRVRPSLLNFPSKDFIYYEPYGSTLIIAPWNYPFQLAIAPLIGAVAAGNTCVLKPSELAPHTSRIVAKIISEVFDPAHVTCVEGGVETAQQLLAIRWDYIFFTGSVAVGKIVARAAAEHLTPTTLELGGKNPCIVDKTAKIALSAKRIAWGKFLNAGQTCIAPDYVLVHEDIKEAFYKALEKAIADAYGQNPQQAADFPRIVNQKHFERLTNLLKDQKIRIGGETNAAENYIAPTVIESPDLESEVMRDEIFGPILPVFSYRDEETIDRIISKYDKPLSVYVFTETKAFAKKIINKHSFGGGTINDTVVHFVNHRLPFGGVGHSGMGAYHGKRSFTTFSHQKAITFRATWLDIALRYPPYGNKLKWLKKMMGL